MISLFRSSFDSIFPNFDGRFDINYLFLFTLLFFKCILAIMGDLCLHEQIVWELFHLKFER